jgi:hypothetical protein
MIPIRIQMKFYWRKLAVNTKLHFSLLFHYRMQLGNKAGHIHKSLDLNEILIGTGAAVIKFRQVQVADIRQSGAGRISFPQ